MRAWVGLLTVVVLAGCAGQPAATPAPPDPPPPAVSHSRGPEPNAGPPSGQATAPDRCTATDGAPLEIWGTTVPHAISGPAECRFTVSTGQFIVHATIHAPTEDAAVGAVAITGTAPLWPPVTRRDRNDPNLWEVTATLADGKVGDTVAVHVTPGPDAPPVTALLTRKGPPTVTILLQGADGTWAPIQSGISLPPGPKRVRFQTAGGLLVDALQPTYLTTNYRHLAPNRVTRIAPDLLEVEFTDPPPLVQVMVPGAANADGLLSLFVNGHFYIGEPPTLVAANATTGTFDTIGPAPADLDGFPALRRDGRYLALTTLIPESTAGQQVWLADLKTGTLTRTPFQYEDGALPGFDARGRLIAPAGPGRLGIMDPATGKVDILKTAATFWSGLSPDGRYMAGRVGPPTPHSTGAWVGPPRAYQLVIRDLLTDTERAFPWTGYGHVDWLPDGRLLLGTVSTDEYPGADPPPEKRMQFFTVDLASGQRTPYSGAWPQTALPAYDGSWLPGDRPLTALPDGRILLYRWHNSGNARPAML